MEVALKKWGNSPALRIPAKVLKAAGFSIDQVLDVKFVDGRIVAEPIEVQEPTIESLLASITPENLHSEFDVGEAIGSEVVCE